MKPLKIGTRDSPLAMWQAEKVQQKLAVEGITSELIPVKTKADIDTQTPLHQFNTVGVFTKMLDEALLENRVDIAVHSLKDYPTIPVEGVSVATVLKRGAAEDILVYKSDYSFLENQTSAIIATGSLRRKAQWLARYPHHQITGLRGNVQTRLKKLSENDWQGAIFAKAGLERANLLPENHIVLDWMIPAPAQGIIGIACRSTDFETGMKLQKVNCEKTFVLAKIERDFLNRVEGGCSAPVGAHAIIKNNKLYLKAGVFALDGSSQIIYDKTVNWPNPDELGKTAAVDVLARGGEKIMREIRTND